MKIISSIFIFCFVLTAHAQNFKITVEKGNYGVVNVKNEQLIPNKYINIIRCANSDKHVMAEAKKAFYIANVETGFMYEIYSINNNFELLSDECYLSEEDKILFIMNNKMGLLQFPEKILIPGKYYLIYLLEEKKDFCIINDKKKFSIYDLKTQKMTDWFEVTDPYESFIIDDERSYLTENEYFFAKFENRIQLMNIEGDSFIIEKHKWKDLYYEDNQLFLSKKDGKYGYVEREGYLEIPYEFEDAGTFDNSTELAYVKKDGKYGYIYSDGQFLIPFIYDKAESYKDGYAKVMIENIEFYIDESGERKDWLEPAEKEIESDNQRNDSDTEAVENMKYGFVNDKGKAVIDYKYDDADFFNFGLAPVKKGTKWGFISQAGSVLIDFKYENARVYDGTLACVKLDDKWGYIDYKGNFIIKNRFEYAESFQFGHAVVGKYINGALKKGVINRYGNLFIDYKYDKINRFKNQKASVMLNNKWGYTNNKDSLIISCQFDDAKTFSNGLAAVKLNEKWGFINDKGKLIIDYAYDDVKGFSSDLTPVKIGDKWGFINKEAEMVIDAVYDDVGHFYYKNAYVKKDGKSYTINRKGECIKNCP